MDKSTGFVARAMDEVDWYNKIEHFINMIEDSPEEYKKMRKNAEDMVKRTFI